ncbi:flavin reductase family protein [Sporosarcina jiandibaonis]|uniref:flavin reductase family protein n=1 Tax=Sporosarcina jiandibaonis TaxID=2715535 RepID=UPI001555BB69|nr:flavin reductase family protein [Sporosarcina jiandibaonis]
MISIDPSKNKERDNYKLMIGSIIPRPIAFVTSLAEDGTLNGAPFSYFNIVSSNPPMVSITVQHIGNEKKDTARNILNKKEFVVHIVNQDNVEKINETAANLPSNESEVSTAGLTQIQSTIIAVPGVEEAKIRMECILEHVVEFDGCDLIIGKIVQFHISKDIYQDGKIDPRGLGAVSRLAGSSYAKIGEIFDIERPK